jgi:hypothetical protein
MMSGISANVVYDSRDNQANPYKGIYANINYLYNLKFLGSDQRARSGRGYVNGRFRGKDLEYGEVEWRIPIWPCSNIIGGVVFVNATTTDNPACNVALFQYILPAVSFGIRVMVNKYFRTNINLDFAISSKSSGFYFSGQETF